MEVALVIRPGSGDFILVRIKSLSLCDHCGTFITETTTKSLFDNYQVSSTTGTCITVKVWYHTDYLPAGGLQARTWYTVVQTGQPVLAGTTGGIIVSR